MYTKYVDELEIEYVIMNIFCLFRSLRLSQHRNTRKPKKVTRLTLRVYAVDNIYAFSKMAVPSPNMIIRMVYAKGCERSYGGIKCQRSYGTEELF